MIFYSVLWSAQEYNTGRAGETAGGRSGRGTQMGARVLSSY